MTVRPVVRPCVYPCVWDVTSYGGADTSPYTLLAEGRSGLTIPASVGDGIDITLPCVSFGVGRYVKYVDSNGYLDIGNSDFTFCMRIKSIGDTSGGTYFGGKASNGTYAYGRYCFGVEATTGYLTFTTSAQGGAPAYTITSDVVFDTAGTVFLRAAIDQTNKIIHFYINETEVGTGTSYEGTFPALAEAYEFFIGAYSNSSGSGILASVATSYSDVQIYNRLLSEADAALVYAGGAAATPRAYWALNDINSFDISGNSYNLTGTNVSNANNLIYGSQGSKLSLNNGYSVYKNDVGTRIQVPNLSLDTDSTVTIADYTKESSVDGSSTFHNMADSMLTFTGDEWDRSNTDNFTESARNDLNLYYDDSYVKRWHTRELNQVNLNNWVTASHSKLFIEMSGDNIDSIFSYKENQEGDELIAILTDIGMNDIINSVTFSYEFDETDHISAMNGDVWVKSTTNKLYLSSDAGETWGSELDSPIAINPQFCKIFDNGNILVADHDSIWLSTNSMVSWTEITPVAYGGGAYSPGTYQNYSPFRFAQNMPDDIFAWSNYETLGDTDVNIWYTVDQGATIKSAYLLGTTTPVLTANHFHGIEYVASDGKFLAWTGDGIGNCHLLRGTYTPGTDTWVWEKLSTVSVGELAIYNDTVYMNIEHYTDLSGTIKKVAYTDIADTSKYEIIYREVASMVSMYINDTGVYIGTSQLHGERLISSDLVNFIKFRIVGGPAVTETYTGYVLRFPENNGGYVAEVLSDDESIVTYIKGPQLRITVD